MNLNFQDEPTPLGTDKLVGYKDAVPQGERTYFLSALKAFFSADSQTAEQSKAANFTAAAGAKYVITASAVVTDPASPTNGQSYAVRISAGTATIGSVGYSAVGSTVLRRYDSGGWATTVVARLSDVVSESDTRAAADGDEANARIAGDAALNYNATFTNTTGNTTLTPISTARKGLIVGTVGGTARTSTIVLAVTGRALYDRFTLRLNIPATAGIVLDVTNATSGGTSLIGGAITTTGATGQSLLLDFWFDGTAFQPLSLIYPTL